MKKLLIATTNPGKLSEIKYFLGDLPLEIISLKDLGIKDKAEENYSTFRANAIHKAKFYSNIAKLPAIADDGGLEIDYLNGLPGVKSRRWVNGRDEATDEQLIAFTLKKLQGVLKEKRKARLRTVVAIALWQGKTYTATAKIEGFIAEKASHSITDGFPYRSLLFLPEIDKFYDQNVMTKEENKKYNHRGKALEKLKKVIDKLYLK